MRVYLLQYGDSPVLSGAVNGRRVFHKLLELAVNEPSQPEALFLDFGGIEVATASFIREGILGFRNYVRGRKSNYYPIVANLSDEVVEEFVELLRGRGDVIARCSLDKSGRVTDLGIIGQLDPKQKITLQAVEAGETDAVTLSRKHKKKDDVSRTAWNNRLSTLSSLGLVVEVDRGRSKHFLPLLEGVQNGR